MKVFEFASWSMHLMRHLASALRRLGLLFPAWSSLTLHDWLRGTEYSKLHTLQLTLSHLLISHLRLNYVSRKFVCWENVVAPKKFYLICPKFFSLRRFGRNRTAFRPFRILHLKFKKRCVEASDFAPQNRCVFKVHLHVRFQGHILH